MSPSAMKEIQQGCTMGGVGGKSEPGMALECEGGVGVGGKALDRPEYKWLFSSAPQKCSLVSSVEREREESRAVPL